MVWRRIVVACLVPSLVACFEDAPWAVAPPLIFCSLQVSSDHQFHSLVSFFSFHLHMCLRAVRRPRDHVNARYLDKRHLYLAVIANYLVRGQAAAAAAAAATETGKSSSSSSSSGAKKSKKGAGGAATAAAAGACPPLLRGGVEGLRFTAPRGGDARKCSLLLRPYKLAGRRFVVRLGVCLAPNALVAARLQPGRSNLRRYWPVDPGVPAAAKAALIEQAQASVAHAHANRTSSSTSENNEQAKKAAAATARAAALAEDASLGMPATPHYNALVRYSIRVPSFPSCISI